MSTKKTFRVPTPTTPLEFTGERFTTLSQGEIRHEHLHRYFFALQFCAGKKVLDIASGEGYGSALLARVASEVIGVDIAKEAIQHATENYSLDNLTFLSGDASSIPVATESIDVVISFETLEHLGAQQEFLREIKRILRPGGLLVMSTPDHEFFADSPPNPFHVEELLRPDFERLISVHFKNSRLFVQSSLTGSLIVPDHAGGQTSYEGFRHLRDDMFESAAGLPGAMYMVTVASDGPLPEVHAGSFDDREFQLGLYAELQRRHIEMLRREADLEVLRGQNRESAEREAQLGIELNRLREESLARTSEVEDQLRRTLEETSQLKHNLTALEGAVRQLDQDLLRSRSVVTELERDKRSLQAENVNLRERISEVQALESLARSEVRALSVQSLVDNESLAVAAGLAAQCDAYRQRISGLTEEIEAIKGSVSWMAFAPFRWIAKPGARIHSSVMRAMYATPAFRYTGKPIARLLSAVRIPGASGLLPRSPLFDAQFYKRRYPDIAQSWNPWSHYLASGSAESRDPHPLFKSAFYNARNPDVAASGVNPLVHYFEHGAREGRDPSPEFDTSYYLQHYPDVATSGMNPLIHFILHGKAEGRTAMPRQTGAGKALPPVQFALAVPTSGVEGQAPFISVLMPTFNTPARYLRLAIESVLRQTYQSWQLCIYDDGSTLPETLETLQEYRGQPRLRVEFGSQNRGIARATNEAIAMASGKYITMLDHDDEIVPEALMEVANVLNGDSAIDALYTDQAYMEADGSLGDPFYKPDWSPEMFRGVMFVGHLLVVRRSLAVELGGFDANFDRVQDFEFMLRVSEKGGKIYHLPKILYFWRRIPGSVAFHGDEKGPIEPIQASAVNAHLNRMRIPAIAEPHPALAHRLIIKPAPRGNAPSVQIVIRDGTGSSEACSSSIGERTTFPNFKIEAGEGSSEYILWIDSDLEVLTPDWIEQLLLYSEQAQIACVTPLIVNGDDTVWNAGLVLGMNGVVGNPMQGWRRDSDGYAGSLSCARETSCVSGECLMISRQKLERLGGLVRYYQDSLYDGADLSLRATTASLRNIVTPRVVLRKHGGSRTSDTLDRALFADRWGAIAKYGDRFYNPNFSQTSPGYEPKKLAATVSG